MKKLIYLTTIFTILVSLTFIPAVQTNAASKVNITYYAGNGYFKSKPNRSKNKITIKNKLNKKRGYAPAIRRDGYTFDGWYTKEKGGKKYSASTIITKKQKLYPHWLKKYKINTNYFLPIGVTFLNISEYEPYWGKLKITKKKKIATYDYEYTLKNHKGDLFYLTTDIHSIDDNNNFTYEYYYFNMECKLKNIINIKKATDFKIFLKKLGITMILPIIIWTLSVAKRTLLMKHMTPILFGPCISIKRIKFHLILLYLLIQTMIGNLIFKY